MAATPEPITVSATVLQQMFLYLRSLHVDIDGFLRSVGVDPATVAAPDARILNATYLHIQDSAAEYVHDPYFGLHMGEFAEAGSWSILGYMMMNCRTLGEALVKSGRYSRIVGNLIEGRAEVLGDTARLVYFTPPHAPAMSRHCFESALASSVRMMRTLTGQPICPLAVTFAHPEPPGPAAEDEYRRVFGCPVSFGQPDTAMTFALGVAYMPIPLANPALLAQFEQYADDLLAQLGATEPFTRSVTKIVLARLDDEALSIEQITYLLGFSEPSVFRKAFKKWWGVTPGEFRQAYSGAALGGAAM